MGRSGSIISKFQMQIGEEYLLARVALDDEGNAYVKTLVIPIVESGDLEHKFRFCKRGMLVAHEVRDAKDGELLPQSQTWAPDAPFRLYQYDRNIHQIVKSKEAFINKDPRYSEELAQARQALGFGGVGA